MLYITPLSSWQLTGQRSYLWDILQSHLTPSNMLINLILPKTISLRMGWQVSEDSIILQIHSFWHNTGVWRTNESTDVHTDRIAVAKTVLRIAACCKSKRRNFRMTAEGHTRSWITVPINMTHLTSRHGFIVPSLCLAPFTRHFNWLPVTFNSVSI